MSSPSRFTVPMIVNGHQLPDDLKQERVRYTIDRFQRELLASQRINTSPCYQRDTVWTKAQARAFIQSCFNKQMAIPPFYLCKRKNSRRVPLYDSLDCRQRTTALIQFFHDKFPITVYDENTAKRNKMKLVWSEINSNDDFVEIRGDFLSREIDVVVFDPMAYEDQRKVFVALNAGTPLNADEHNYCPNFLARRVLENVFERVFRSDAVVNYEYDASGAKESPGTGLASQLQTSVRCGRRFAHLRTMHEVLILSRGVVGKKNSDSYEVESPKPRGCKRVDRQYSAEAMHKLLRANNFDYDDEVTDETLELLGLTDCVKGLTEVADFLADIFDREPHLGRSTGKGSSDSIDTFLLARNAIDPLCFLYTIIHDGYTSISNLRKDRRKVIWWLENYYPLKLELDYNAATSDVLTMTGKYLIMRELYNRLFNAKVPKWATEDSIDNSKLTDVRKKVGLVAKVG